MKYLFTIIMMTVFWLSPNALSAQVREARIQQDTVIQFAGYVVTEGKNGDVAPLAYTNIAVEGTSRGTTCDKNGYFSFVAVKGETVVFTRIGFEDVKYTIPDTLDGQFYSYVQIMSESDELLPEAVIYPWPDKDYFKYEFLAIDISDDLRRKAEENVAEEVLRRARNTVPVDGREAMRYETQRTFNEHRTMGQYKTSNLFNPIAWKQFIDAWRRGDFKKKKKK